MTKHEYHYRRFRAHQHDVFANGGGTLTTEPSGRTELSYGSAPYGCHAMSAFTAAKRHAYFLVTIREAVAKDKNRARAAKTRKRNKAMA